MTSESRVLISGAGIAGNAVAWLLARTGAKVVVLERADKMLAQGQNVDMQGSALTAVKRMGLYEQIRSKNTTEKGTNFVDPNGKPFALFPQEKGRPSPTNEHEILRSDLAQLLYDRAKTESGIEYRFGTTIEKVLENNEKIIKVQLSNGQVESFDYAIAADGQWSKLRRMCFPDEDTTVVDKDAYSVYFTAHRQPDDTNWWQIYHALRSRVISIRPDPYGTVRFCSTIMPCNDKQRQRWKDAMRRDRKTQEALIKEEFADAGWQAERFLKAMPESTDFYCHGLQQIQMKSWSTGRVCCVGDAAWAPTPLTGQGVTLAMTGAYLLAAELEKAPANDPMSAFKAFDQLYHDHVFKMQDLPSFVPSIAHPASALKRWLLGSLLSVVSYVVSFPILVNRLGFDQDPEKNDDGFPLPSYPSFDAKLVV